MNIKLSLTILGMIVGIATTGLLAALTMMTETALAAGAGTSSCKGGDGGTRCLGGGAGSGVGGGGGGGSEVILEDCGPRGCFFEHHGSGGGRGVGGGSP